MSKLEILSTHEPLGEAIQFVKGWDDALIGSVLMEKSKEPTMLQSVPKDAAERFQLRDSMQRWLRRQPERVFYSLFLEDELSGVIWFTPAPGPQDSTHTFAIRLYESGQGRHLALPFMRVAHDDLGADAVWLETDTANTRAQNLYQKFGYKTIDSIENTERITMVYEQKTKQKPAL